jgi:hypothetical protein
MLVAEKEAAAAQRGNNVTGISDAKVNQLRKDVLRRHRILVCKSCGHPIPDNDVIVLLSGKQRRLFEIIARAGSLGIGVHEIMPELYALDPTGGPTSTNIISVMAHYINRKINPFGLALACRRGPFGVWRLIEMEEKSESQTSQSHPGG